MKLGTLYGIGVGPGDPELLTIKAKRILEEVNVLFIPRSRLENRSLALSIVSGLVKKEWDCVDLLLPMTRDGEALLLHWQEAAQEMLRVLQNGEDAAFITLGDPGMYSTFSYLLRNLRKLEPSLKVEIIPGVSSIHAISAWIQEPLAEGEESLIIVPALKETEQLQTLLKNYDNVVLLKAGRQLARINEILQSEGDEADRQVFLASRCGFVDGFYTEDLKAYEHRPMDYLSTLIIKRRRAD